MSDTTQQDKITALEARVHWLEQRLYLACDSFYKLGYEQDGPNRMTERFGVDASAARRVLEAIGPWQRTNFDNVQAIQLPPPTVQQQRPSADAHMNKKVVWSKDPSFRWL